MRVLVTGSSGHLGEALVRRLKELQHAVTGVDILPSPFTTHVGSIANRDVVRDCMHGVDAVLHAATLHKPHVATHNRQDFVDTNVTGTLNLLEEAVAVRAGAFVFTSTTSAFGDALTPAAGAPAAWITEEVAPRPRNIYGATKTAAEDLCQVFARKHALPCLVLRTSRFFPEVDDSADVRASFADANIKANEFLHRRVDIEDVVSAHMRALENGAATWLRQAHRQRHDALQVLRLAGAADESLGGPHEAGTGVRGHLRGQGVESPCGDRPRVRQRSCPQPPGMGARVRLRTHSSLPGAR
jgi:nucleoside-diphosphate-sugar epimerase